MKKLSLVLPVIFSVILFTACGKSSSSDSSSKSKSKAPKAASIAAEEASFVDEKTSTGETAENLSEANLTAGIATEPAQSDDEYAGIDRLFEEASNSATANLANPTAGVATEPAQSDDEYTGIASLFAEPANTVPPANLGDILNYPSTVETILNRATVVVVTADILTQLSMFQQAGDWRALARAVAMVLPQAAHSIENMSHTEPQAGGVPQTWGQWLSQCTPYIAESARLGAFLIMTNEMLQSWNEYQNTGNPERLFNAPIPAMAAFLAWAAPTTRIDARFAQIFSQAFYIVNRGSSLCSMWFGGGFPAAPVTTSPDVSNSLPSDGTCPAVASNDTCPIQSPHRPLSQPNLNAGVVFNSSASSASPTTLPALPSEAPLAATAGAGEPVQGSRILNFLRYFWEAATFQY